MILTAHQPVYLPWLGLLHKIALADLFVSFDRVQYVPKDWISRNRIKTAQGPIWLTVPVRKQGHLNPETTITDIEIDNSRPWWRKHWRSIEMAYGKAPYFAHYAPFFEALYTRQWQKLAELNVFVLQWLLETLSIDVPIRRAGEFAFGGRKSELVLDMCRTLGADLYVFGSLGRQYADTEAFERAGVTVAFQEYNHPSYPQLHGAFMPNLSVIDLLFNCGEASRDIIMSGNITRADLRKVLQQPCRHPSSA